LDQLKFVEPNVGAVTTGGFDTAKGSRIVGLPARITLTWANEKVAQDRASRLNQAMRNQKAEAQIIERVLKSVRLPAEVKSYTLEFTEDSTGVPAVWINLNVDEDNSPSDSKIEKLVQLKRRITSALFKKEITSWPYVRYESL